MTAQYLKVVAFVFFAVGASTAMPAEIDEIGKDAPARVFSIKGELRSGDYARLRASILNSDKYIAWVHIDSPGGDVLEAMRIGRLLRTLSLRTQAGRCNSACVLAWIGGAERTANGDIGLHRPYFDRSYFADLTQAQAESKYAELSTRVEQYLKEMNVPQEAIELIFRTSSSDISYVGPENNWRLFARLSAKAPAYDEWILSKCGSPPITLGEMRKIAQGSTDEDLWNRYGPWAGCTERARVVAFEDGLRKARSARE